MITTCHRICVFFTAVSIFFWLGCSTGGSGGNGVSNCAADNLKCANPMHYLIDGKCYDTENVEETGNMEFIPAAGAMSAADAVCVRPDSGMMNNPGAGGGDCPDEEKMCLDESHYPINGKCYAEEDIANPEAGEDEALRLKPGAMPDAEFECYRSSFP